MSLDYMRGRWSDPQLGRFLQEDPIHSGVNDYTFAGDDPINGSDPSGLDGDCITIIEPSGEVCSGGSCSYFEETIKTVCVSGGTGGGSLTGLGPSGGNGGNGGNGKGQQPKPKPQVCNVPVAPPDANITRNIRLAESHRFNVWWFYTMVHNKAPWDYKQQGPAYQDFGNFDFGATGTAVGLRDVILLRAAGWAQGRAGTSLPQWGAWWGGPPFGDDPADQVQIQRGVQYYKAVKSGQCSH